jgi:hypothetical protein
MKWSVIFLFLITALSTNAQSINGKLNAAESKYALSYGNVDIYKGEKLVATVLTDRSGNFNVALDTGEYTCVIQYAGYESLTKKITVRKDETVDFSVSKDKEYEAKREELSEVAITPIEVKSRTRHRTSSADFIDYDGIFDSPAPGMGSGRSGALTAGEINDFSKWKLWQDISSNELQMYQTNWNIAPYGRYTVMLQNTVGIPLADAEVILKENDKVLFTTRTDNTGKAECWLTIKNEKPEIKGKLQLIITYKGTTKKLDRVKVFEDGFNHLSLDVSCEASQNVDVAFVVDATGSMGDEIDYLKAELNEIVFQSKQISNTLNFRFANIFYRDKGPSEMYTTRVMDFNRVLTASSDFIAAQNAGGGGDYEEAVEVALDSAINKLSWSDEARTRILFLVLDAPPHNTVANQEKLRELIAKAAEKGIRIVPVGASGINKSTEYLMRTLALGTNGTYTFLTNHSGIGNPHMEPSTDKYDVETMTKLMVRILKSYTYMPDCEQQIPDLGLNYPDSIVTTAPTDSLDSITPAPYNNQAKITWSYYPNPTNGIVTLVADTDIPELYITDLSGKVLQIVRNLEKGRLQQVDLSEYATGIYLIRYPIDTKWYSGKIVLQRTS